jgi:hypothetical protein
METLESKSKNLRILVLDKPGHGNASHEYRIVKKQENDDAEIFASISFQNGPIKENGVNGCTQEILLQIVLHRLDSFQSGGFGCSENTIASIHVQEALKSLNRRTIARQARGVEGKTIK